MRTAGLRSISAKQLALSCQCIGMLTALHPLLRAGSLALVSQPRRALLIPEFDRLLTDLALHTDEIHSKLVDIMRDRLAASVAALPAELQQVRACDDTHTHTHTHTRTHTHTVFHDCSCQADQVPPHSIPWGRHRAETMPSAASLGRSLCCWHPQHWPEPNRSSIILGIQPSCFRAVPPHLPTHPPSHCSPAFTSQVSVNPGEPSPSVAALARQLMTLRAVLTPLLLKEVRPSQLFRELWD
jgi:hypothetical protein